MECASKDFADDTKLGVAYITLQTLEKWADRNLVHLSEEMRKVLHLGRNKLTPAEDGATQLESSLAEEWPEDPAGQQHGLTMSQQETLVGSLKIRKHYFTLCVIEHWRKLPRETGKSSSLEIQASLKM